MPTKITSTTIALAAEALTRCPGLTPTARRVGHELLNYTDRATGLAWPSEARLADTLGVTVRTIQKAKAQLRQRGLLTWRQRGRHPQRTPVYQLVWAALVALARGIKARVKRVATRYTSIPRSPSGLGTNIRSHYLPQKNNSYGFGEKKQAPGKLVQRQTSTAPTHSPELLRNRAHSRLYEALTATFDQVALGNLFERMTPDIEARAMDAEQRRWGTGIGVVIEAVTGRCSLRLATEKVAI